MANTSNYRQGESYDQFMRRQGTPAKPLTTISEKDPQPPSNPRDSKPVEELIKEMLGHV